MKNVLLTLGFLAVVLSGCYGGDISHCLVKIYINPTVGMKDSDPVFEVDFSLVIKNNSNVFIKVPTRFPKVEVRKSLTNGSIKLAIFWKPPVSPDGEPLVYSEARYEPVELKGGESTMIVQRVPIESHAWKKPYQLEIEFPEFLTRYGIESGLWTSDMPLLTFGKSSFISLARAPTYRVSP